MWVWSLGQEDPLEKGGHGNLLQYSCLENLMDRGAWRATVHRVTQSDMTEQALMHTHSETAQLRLGLGPTAFSLKSHTWSQNLMMLRLFMSSHRKNSVRYKVIGKKGIYLERYIFHRQNAVCLKRWVQLWEKHTLQAECGLSQKMRDPRIWGG